MDSPSDNKRTYCVYGIWHREKNRPFVYKNKNIELHLYDTIEEAVDFISIHSPQNVNITWCITWDIYKIQELKNKFMLSRVKI